MKKPKRLPYEFSEESSDHYYQYYFQKKHIDEEDNFAILFEIVAVSIGSEKSLKTLRECSDQRIKLLKTSKTTFDFVFNCVNGPLINSILLFKDEYFKIFSNICSKKKLWDDLVYKFKFKHLHPDLDYNFENPYENSDELIF